VRPHASHESPFTVSDTFTHQLSGRHCLQLLSDQAAILPFCFTIGTTPFSPIKTTTSPSIARIRSGSQTLIWSCVRLSGLRPGLTHHSFSLLMTLRVRPRDMWLLYR